MAIAGVGTKFMRYSAGAYSEIANVKNIGGPSFSRETYDSTTLSTTGGYRTFIAGFRQGGTVDMTVQFERDDFETLKGDFESDAEVEYMIELPDTANTTIQFAGLVTEMPLDIPPDDIITMAVSIMISGAPSIDSGSQSPT